MKEQKKNKNNKNYSVLSIVFFVVFLFVCLLSVGYSAYSESLSIDGKGIVRADLDVRITDIKVKSTSNGGVINSNPEYMASSPTTSYIISDVKLPNASSTVTYEVEVTNLSALKVLVTNINTISDTNPNIEYEISNLVVNSTKIANASTYKFDVTIKYKNGASTANTNEISKINFTFYKIPMYNYSITVDQSDAKIELTINGVTQNATGSFSGTYEEGTVISYKVTKDLYIKQTGSDTLNSNITKNITLVRGDYYYLTINTNTSLANITVKDSDNETVATGSGTSLRFLALANTTYSYNVTGFEYYEQNGTHTMPRADSSITVNLTEWPGFTDQKANSEYDTAEEGTITVTRTGYYLVELWGGTGGQDYQGRSTKGASGYIYATVELKADDQIYYTLGGNGENGKLARISNGGANGGATGVSVYPGAGGGYSAIALGVEEISEANINNGKVLMIAGGGGGCGAGFWATNTPSYGNGGSGGTLSSTHTTNSVGIVYYGSDGGYNKYQSRAGKGGTTTGGAGGTASNNTYGTAGSLLTGGQAGNQDSANNGGNGGAGYYGGGGGAGRGTTGDGAGAGGGGSSLISTKLGKCTAGNTKGGTLLGANPSSTGGAFKITFVSR